MNDQSLRWPERVFITIALLGQQDAFLNVARVLEGKDSSDQVGASTDPLNVLMVAFTIGGLVLLLARRPNLLSEILQHGVLIFTLCGLTLVSALWSDGAGLTSKRAIVHLNTVMFALYLAARLNFRDALRCVAAAAAIAAVGSFIAGALFHKIGVMHTPGLVGRWRGVYSHKNPLAQAMAIGVIIEGYLILVGRRRPLHFFMIALESALIVLSNSVTVLAIVCLALFTYTCFSLFKLGGFIRRLLVVALPAILGLVLSIIMVEPNLLHAISGRDASLSGRTELWSGVMHAITLRPLLGYGYQAFWDAADPLGMAIWQEIGWNAPNAHSGVLEVALEVGFLGLLLTALVIGQAFRRASWLFKFATTQTEAITATIILTGICLESLTEAVFLRQGDIDWFMLNLVSFACLQLALHNAPAAIAINRSILSRAKPIIAHEQGEVLVHNGVLGE